MSSVHRRPSWPAEPGKLVAHYLGSGRAGACFAADGLMDPADAPGVVRTGRTVLSHAEHWSPARWGLDQQCPVARVHWETPIGGAGRPYSQTYDTARGRLDTRLAWDGGSASVVAGFSPAEGRRDVLALDLALSGRAPAVIVAPERSYLTCYDESLSGPPAAWADHGGGLWSTRVRLGRADSCLAVLVHGPARVSARSGNLRVAFSAGRRGLLVASAAWARRDELLAILPRLGAPSAFLAAAARAWATRRGAASVRLPDPGLDGLFERSHHHLLASFEPDPRCPAPPCGWSGNAWGFHFPQDISYIHPSLLRLGHLDLARGIVDFYASRLPLMEETTRRLYGAAGVLWAWEFPIGADTRILPDGRAPNPFQFEIHNAAYPARMAAETARHLGDRDWGRAVAWPVVLASARFYASVLKRGRDGLWGLHVKPSMGQDEYGGENAPDYLCALYAAEYTLATALRLARQLGLSPPADEAAAWRRVLAEGFAYPRLLQPRLGRILATSAAPGYALGRQKHPIQLNPLTFLPIGRIDDTVRRAYASRHAICSIERPDMRHPGALGSFYSGWTLAAFWLAAVRMGDAPGLEHELRQTLVSQYADPEWLQIYESSGFWKPYYLTSEGLFLQTVTDAFVQDWSGRVRRHAAVPESWRGATYSGLRTADGRVHSGSIR